MRDPLISCWRVFYYLWGLHFLYYTIMPVRSDQVSLVSKAWVVQAIHDVMHKSRSNSDSLASYLWGCLWFALYLLFGPHNGRHSTDHFVWRNLYGRELDYIQIFMWKLNTHFFSNDIRSCYQQIRQTLVYASKMTVLNLFGIISLSNGLGALNAAQSGIFFVGSGFWDRCTLKRAPAELPEPNFWHTKGTCAKKLVLAATAQASF